MNLQVSSTFLAVLLLSGAAHSNPVADTFVPEEVFAGRSDGKGELRLFRGRARPFTVESVGTLQGDGQLRLEQTMRFEGRPVQTRFWVMQQTGPGRYSATLSDAAGPVVGRVEGRRLTLQYPLRRWGLVMHQTLDLDLDGRSIANFGSIRFLGIRIGELRETIYLVQ